MRFLPIPQWLLITVMVAPVAYAADPASVSIPRLQLVPLPGQQVSFQIDGIEKTRWHFGNEYPRPFFYPFNGPSGVSLTRMGHPGAPNHDHHRSVWFAHHDVDGVDFWSDQTEVRIRQKRWLAYFDSDEETIMVSLLEWKDGDRKVLMEQELVAALLEMPNGEHGLEIQITMRPPADAETVELGKTNFGFFAVRVAKSISGFFGGGTISSSEGESGEGNIFGKRARWLDYSGPIAVSKSPNRKAVTEGITYFDHPSNPRYPTYWHVREDGWMGASFGMHAPYQVTKNKPLVLRYLLHAHRGDYHAAKAGKVHASFANRPGFLVTNGTAPHVQFNVARIRLNARE